MQFACERVTTEAYLHFFRGGKKVVTRNLYGHVLDKCRRALWYKLAVLCWRTEKKKKRGSCMQSGGTDIQIFLSLQVPKATLHVRA